MLKSSLKTDMVEVSFRKMRLTFYKCLNVENDVFTRKCWVMHYTRTQFWGVVLFFVLMLSHTDNSLETLR